MSGINMDVTFRNLSSIDNLSEVNPKDGDVFYVKDQEKMFVYVDNSVQELCDVELNPKPNKIIRLTCESCGAPLGRDLVCHHCGAIHMAV